MRILNERLYHLEQESGRLRERVREQRNKALRDTLTGINNRLAYDERIEIEYSRWKRFKTPVAFMVWDVDSFKAINDTFGHHAGDKVLAAIAKLLVSQIRESDFLARYGGEEFVLIAPGANCEEALNLAEKLRRKVESSQFVHGDDVVPVTVSCGIAEFKEGYTMDQVFEAADNALYQAKVQGRNRCICAE
jgi:diguanylate cyclase